MNRRTRLLIALVCAAGITATGTLVAHADEEAHADSRVLPAECGPGSSPETGLQGQVPLADRKSGRNKKGYSCNLELLGQYQGEGASWVNPSYQNCAYMATSFLPSIGAVTKKSQGVQVLDVSNPRQPKLTTNLTTPAMLQSPWESLKVNEERGLLAGVGGGPVAGALFFDVYDVKSDCAHPKLLNRINLKSPDGNEDGKGHSLLGGVTPTVPANALGHEGTWSQDGKTFWSSSALAPSLSAIDVSDPAKPRLIYTGVAGGRNHGMSLSEDGRRLYLSTTHPAGLVTLDVSDVQDRAAVPSVREVSRVSWNTLGAGQASIPVTYDGTPHLIVFDEFASEGVRIFDISDDKHPREVRHLQLEIQYPENVDIRRKDTTGNGIFGYDSHYCDVDRKRDPTALACGYFHSGVRVFDIREPEEPREIAYYNPPAQVGKNLELTGSEHAANLAIQSPPPASDAANLNLGGLIGEDFVSDLSADYCSSPPRFVGSGQLWVTCQDNGFLALRFTNDSYPRSNG